MRWMIVLSLSTLLVSAMAGGLPALAKDAVTLEETWRWVDLGTYIGNRDIYCVDVDGDGAAEILLDAYQSKFFAILESRDDQYSIRWTSRWYGQPGLARVLVANLDGDADLEVYALLTDGQLEVYDGSTMDLMSTHATGATSAACAKFGDVDGDGETELVIAGPSYVRVLDASTMIEEWSTTEYGGTDLEVGQLDEDPAGEIALVDGTVLDGVTHEEQWYYSLGFGQEIELGDLEDDGIMEILAMSPWYYITAFSAQYETPLWQIDTGSDHDAFLVTDVEGDGDLDLLMGNGQWGDINCYSATTQQLLWKIDNPEHGTTGIGIGDVDADGVPEVVWGAGQTSSGADYLYVGSTDFHQIEWQSQDLDGPFSVGVGGDGSASIVVASRGSNSGYDQGVVMSFHAADGTLEWMTRLGSYQDDVYTLAVGDIRDEAGEEIVLGLYGSFRVWTAEGQELLNEAISGTVTDIELADVDGDLTSEIVVADSGGYVSIYDADTLQREWRSINTGRVDALALANLDADPAMEICFFGSVELQVYDGSTHFLEDSISAIQGILCLDIADVDRDGDPDFITGDSNGLVQIFDAQSLESLGVIDTGTAAVHSVEAVNLTADYPGLEILCGSDRLYAFDSTLTVEIFQSDALSSNVGDYDGLVSVDLDEDQYLDVLVGSTWGVFRFEATVPYPDITPPSIVAVSPPIGLTLVGLDAQLRVTLSESIDPASFDQASFGVSADGIGEIPTTWSYDEGAKELVGIPDDGLPPEAVITVTVHPQLQDAAGNTLDGNGNGISEGSPDDEFQWSFTTGAGLDLVGPTFADVQLDRPEVWRGVLVQLTATVSDESDVAVSGVLQAEMFLDSIGDPGTGIPLEPVDGVFDSTQEAVQLEFDTDDFEFGDHTLYLHAQDNNGNWGDVFEVSLHVILELASNWPMLGGDPQHTGYNRTEVFEPPYALAWNLALSTNALHQAVVVNDLVYVSRRGGTAAADLWALDLEDGSIAWSKSFGSVFSVNPPSFSYGNVYIQTCNHSSDSFVWAFDSLTGDEVWKSPYSAQWEQHLAPTIADGKVFVNGGYYGGMYAYDAFTGNSLWFVPLTQSDSWTPAYHDGVAYAYVQGHLTAVNARTGFLLWSKDFTGFHWTRDRAPVIDASTNSLLLTSLESFYVVDMTTQETGWSQSGQFGLSPAVRDGKVYTIQDGHLNVYDVASGEELKSFGTNLNYSPVLTDDLILVSSASQVQALDRQTYAVRWSHAAGGHLTVGRGHLLVSTPAGHLICFKRSVVPTLLDNFSAKVTPGQVELSWRIQSEADPAPDFKIVGRLGSQEWTVPHETLTGGGFVATDVTESWPDAATIEYTLLHRYPQTPWVELATRSVTTSATVLHTRLQGAVPNPFNPRTSIRFTLDHAQKVKVVIYDLGGRRVRVLTDQELSRGTHDISWDGTDERGASVASGAYVVRLEAEQKRESRKITLLR